MTRTLVILNLIAAAATGGYIYLWVPQDLPATVQGGSEGGPSGGFAAPIDAATVRDGTAVETIPTVGSLRSDESVLIGPKIEGRISHLQVDEGIRDSAGMLLVDLAAIAKRTLPASTQTGLSGQSLGFKESSVGLYVTFLLAFLFIYVVPSAQFKSFKNPFIIMLNVPLAMVGALRRQRLEDERRNVRLADAKRPTE